MKGHITIPRRFARRVSEAQKHPRCNDGRFGVVEVALVIDMVLYEFGWGCHDSSVCIDVCVGGILQVIYNMPNREISRVWRSTAAIDAIAFDRCLGHILGTRADIVVFEPVLPAT